jgi:hypothetical protein
MLWPLSNSKSASKERGKRLRSLVSASDITVLEDKKFRNHFEHFDERLDKWAEHPTKPLLDGWIAYNGANFSLDENESMLRTFDAKNFTVFFYGEKYPLEPLIEAINKLQARVHSVARERLAKKSRE